MGRRNRDFDYMQPLAGGIALPAVLLISAIISPTMREAIHPILPLLVAVFIISIAFTAFFIHRDKKRRPTRQFVQNIRDLDWFQFEKIVGILFQKLGYIVIPSGGANPDGGIDLTVEKDGQRQAVQCKQWKTRDVGVKTVREFLGALTDSGIPSGIFVTLNGCTPDAKALADKHGIQILNESHLSQMLKSVDAQNDPEILALLQDTRKFCPKCGSEMVLRTAEKGRSPRQPILGLFSLSRLSIQPAGLNFCFHYLFRH